MITKKMNYFKFILLILFVFLLIFLRKSYNLINYYQNKFYPNIYINDIYVGEKQPDQIGSIIDSVNQKLTQEKLVIFYQQQPIATFSGIQLNLHFDKEKLVKKAHLIGRERNLLQRFISLTNIFLLKRNVVIEEKIKYNRQALIDFIDYVENIYNKPARNALFKFQNGRVIAFKKEENGLMVLSDKLLAEVEKSLIDNSKIKKIYLETKIIVPEITLGKINNFGIEEKIGHGVSDFSGSISERIYNITLAASKFNGILIPPGKIFSFNETLGEVSALTGYKQAYVIKEGKTVLGDGGGVCQVSTTLFRAALNTGLPIIERIAHTYRVRYYENDSKPGLDATVYAPYVDFKFKNDTPAYILIEMEINKEKNQLFFNFYGKKDSRKVIISPITIWDVIPPPETQYQEDPALKKGVIKQIEWSAWGAKTSFSYQVVKEGKTIFEKNFYSYYRPWPAVFLVGTAN